MHPLFWRPILIKGASLLKTFSPTKEIKINTLKSVSFFFFFFLSFFKMTFSFYIEFRRRKTALFFFFGGGGGSSTFTDVKRVRTSKDTPCAIGEKRTDNYVLYIADLD